ncbi:ABC transporter, permease protein, putative [Synechococcus sp. PCC 7335]|uniref:ABC transporter permease n=1 Tax=Synechococcus sp. (strain ATCC 29403 / PCC 7335) TaxID=91464 RepID=UPI00017ED5E9|nr:ABC transporter permease [Synechococcus sp. PCC 7335]EDX84279.1 ABC transporter, permease protein, putative [Synechococcus sp. PCC 7335]
MENLAEFFISIKDGLLYYIPGVGRPDRVLEFLLGHLLITLVTMMFAVLISVPIGILITRVRSLYDPVIKLAGMLYTVPSLAMFGVLVPIFGIGFRPAIVALTLYSLLAIIRNTAVGINGVDPAVIESARGMGMRDHAILMQLELPLAMPVIFAGIRIATVSTISLATLASFFGADSLGSLIFEGISAGGTRNDKIVAGAIGAALLAIVFDWAISRIENALPGSAAR